MGMMRLKTVGKYREKSPTKNACKYHKPIADSSSDLLAGWLRIPERIEYKIALLTYKVMNGMHRDIWDHLSVSLTCLADGLCALRCSH